MSVFKKKVEEVKQRKAVQVVLKHINDHKTAYIAGTSVVVGIVGGYAVANNKDSAKFVQNITQIGFGNRVNTAIVTFIENSTPSRPVHFMGQDGTDLYFNSLSEAARITGHTLSMISRNVNGIIDNVKGDVFEVVDLV